MSDEDVSLKHQHSVSIVTKFQGHHATDELLHEGFINGPLGCAGNCCTPY